VGAAEQILISSWWPVYLIPIYKSVSVYIKPVNWQHYFGYSLAGTTEGYFKHVVFAF